MSSPQEEIVLDRKKLSDLDEARDYNAASSYNFLNAELRRFRLLIQAGGVVRVEEPHRTVVLSTEYAFTVWASRRYPFSDQS